MRQFFNNRQHAALLLRGIDRFCARPGRFPTDVDNVGTFANHFSTLLIRLFRIEEPSSIRKRIGRHVQHTHDPTARVEIENFISDFPMDLAHKGETITRISSLDAYSLWV